MTETIEMISQGKQALESGDVKSALETFEEVTRVDSNNYDAFVFLAIAYSKQSRYNRAIGALKRASEIRPDSAQVHYNLAQAYEAAGVPKEAYNEYKLALDINAFYTKAREAIAKLSDRLPELTAEGIQIEGDK